MKKVIYLLIILFSQTALAQNVPSYVPTNGLVGWWPFTGNAVDSSGNGNDFTVNGPVLTSDRFGNSNKAYKYLGLPQAAQYLITNQINSFKTPSFSYSLWFNTDSFYPNTIPSNPTDYANFNMQTLLSMNNNSSWSIGPAILNGLYMGDNTKVYTSAWNPNLTGGPQQNATSSLISTNIWYNIIITYKGSTLTVYLNGAQVLRMDPLYVNFSNQNDLLLGGARNGTNMTPMGGFKGVIDDFGWWNRELTSCEINQLVNAGIQGTAQTPLVLYNNGTLSVSGGPYVSYQWFLNGVAIQGANNATYMPILNGIYSVSVSSGNCGSYTSQGYVMNSVGINNINEHLISIYPNPAKDKLYIKDMSEYMQVKIYNAVGQLMLESNQKEINIAALSNGQYFIILFDEQKQLIQNEFFIKE